MVDHRDILISDDVVTDPERIRTILSRRVGEVLEAGSPDDADLRVVRLVVPLEAVDPFAWLQAQTLLPRIYWNGRDDELVTAAVGTADRCYGGPGADYDELRSQLDVVLPKSDARVRYFGGFRFDRSRHAHPEWSPFGTFTFTLPRFEYMLRGERAILACNLLLPRDRKERDRILQEIDRLQFDYSECVTNLPTPVSRTDRPDRAGWERNIDWSVDAFRSGRLEKVVLARRSTFGFGEPVDPIALLSRLQDGTANSFVFGFQFNEEGAFVGATPERLFRRNGRRIWTEAVAGTRPRGETPDEDKRMMSSLLESEKDQREHAYVRDSIRQALLPLCDEFSIDSDASGMKLTRGWHLVSRSRGMLKADVHGSEVMRALHPTPAVGGHPTEEAVSAIASLESFDRGWYTGPVGWIGSQGAEFAVALRCGLVRQHHLALYSGAGIVEGSDPDAEWAEIEQKIGDFAKIFGLEPRRSG